MVEVSPKLGLQDQVHRSDQVRYMVSGGSDNCVKKKKMPTSCITSNLDGHWALGNSTLSYGERSKLNGGCTVKVLMSDVLGLHCPNRCSVHSVEFVSRSVSVSGTKI